MGAESKNPQLLNQIRSYLNDRSYTSYLPSQTPSEK